MDFYQGKKILIAGGTGMIGKQLVDILIERGAKVRIASLDDQSRANPQAEFKRADLTSLENCLNVCKDMEYVFNLAGIKGSPKMMKERPASYFVPSILFSINLMEAARQTGAERFLFTSSIGVYAPAEIFYEDSTENSLPSTNDLFGGWHKRTGELQAEAYKTEYGLDQISIVRPANVYGPFDNFDPENAMVIPSLINRAFSGENPFIVWGDGSQIRDFIHAKDVARGMAEILEIGYNKPVNLGSGNGYTIKEIAENIISNLDCKPEILWDTSKPSGDKKRLMDISRAKSLGWKPTISLGEGIRDTINWYINNKHLANNRYNVFRQKQ